MKPEDLIRDLRILVKESWVGHENYVLLVESADLIEQLLAKNRRLREALRAKVGPVGNCGTNYCSGCDVCRAMEDSP